MRLAWNQHVRFDSFLSCTCTKAGSSKVWYGGGQPWIHSILVAVNSGWSTFRFAEKASQTMNMSMITAVIEIKEPIEDSVFHSV